MAWKPAEIDQEQAKKMTHQYGNDGHGERTSPCHQEELHQDHNVAVGQKWYLPTAMATKKATSARPCRAFEKQECEEMNFLPMGSPPGGAGLMGLTVGVWKVLETCAYGAMEYLEVASAALDGYGKINVEQTAGNLLCVNEYGAHGCMVGMDALHAIECADQKGEGPELGGAAATVVVPVINDDNPKAEVVAVTKDLDMAADMHMGDQLMAELLATPSIPSQLKVSSRRRSKDDDICMLAAEIAATPFLPSQLKELDEEVSVIGSARIMVLDKYQLKGPFDYPPLDQEALFQEALNEEASAGEAYVTMEASGDVHEPGE